MAYFNKYRLDEFDDQVAFIKKEQFASLVSQHEEGLLSTSLPFYIEEDSVDVRNKTLTLVAHMSVVNPQYKTPLVKDEVLLVFTGPNTYITPSWSPSKKVDHKVVPTWNYGTVQVYGTLIFDTEKEHKRQAVSSLTNVNEKGRAVPWKVTDAPPASINAKLDGIVVVRVRVKRMIGIHKYSQGESEPDRQGIVEGLWEEGRQCPRSKAVAEVMGHPSDAEEEEQQRSGAWSTNVITLICVCWIGVMFFFIKKDKK